jgi:hypothetical protein
MMSAREPTATFNSSRDAQHRTALRIWSAYAATVVAKLRDLAPYAAILVLPGGSLVALLLWLYQRQKKASFFPTH